jgi:hypothetical protein
MSLSNLRLVFEKLGSQDKKTVIDYTQSTLTKVMRDSLGGNVIIHPSILMLICVVDDVGDDRQKR